MTYDLSGAAIGGWLLAQAVSTQNFESPTFKVQGFCASDKGETGTPTLKVGANPEHGTPNPEL